MITADPLFQVPGVRAIAQHFFVMIRFEDQHPALIKLGSDQTGSDTEIGSDPDPPLWSVDNKSDRITGIVCNRKWCDFQITQIKTTAG